MHVRAQHSVPKDRMRYDPIEQVSSSRLSFPITISSCLSRLLGLLLLHLNNLHVEGIRQYCRYPREEVELLTRLVHRREDQRLSTPRTDRLHHLDITVSRDWIAGPGVGNQRDP